LGHGVHCHKTYSYYYYYYENLYNRTKSVNATQTTSAANKHTNWYKAVET